MEEPLVQPEGEEEGEQADRARRRWKRSVSIIVDKGGTVRACRLPLLQRCCMPCRLLATVFVHKTSGLGRNDYREPRGQVVQGCALQDEHYSAAHYEEHRPGSVLAEVENSALATLHRLPLAKVGWPF